MSTARMPTPYIQPVGQALQYNNMAPVSGSYPVFSARRKTEQVDWRKIAALNIDQMAQAFDFNTLQENIYSITFCDIESEVDMRLVDPNYVKLFKLSQLTIEYLLNSQEYLTHQLGVLEETMKQYQQNVEDTKAQCDKLQKEMSKVAKESHKRKKLLMAQQQLIHGIPGNYHKCNYCPKAFLHHSYLQKHLGKRHAEASEPTNTPDVDTSSGHGSGSRSSIPAGNVISALEKQLKAMKDDLLVVQERELQKEAEIKNLTKLFEERDNQYEADLVDLRRKLIKQSNLGSICDDDDENNEPAAVVSKKDVESVPVGKKVKSKSTEPLLEKKVQSLEENFNKQFKKQEKKWQTEIENVKKKYQQEITLLQQKQKEESAVIPSTVIAKSVKRKLNYSQKPIKMNEPKKQPSKKENTTAEITLTQVIPIEKSEYSEDDDDDDDEMELETEEEEEEESEKQDKERKKDEVKEINSVEHTMETTMSTTGSLTERMQQVYQQVTHNTKIKQEMRIEMANLLSEKLEKIGLPQGTKQISKKTLSDKLSIMKKERLSKSKRFPNFEKERQYLNQLAETTAKKKLASETVEKMQAKMAAVKAVQKQQPKTSAKKSAVVSKFPSPSKSKTQSSVPSPITSKRQSSLNLQTSNTSLYQSSLPPKPQSSLTHSPSKQWSRELWKQDSEDDDKGKSDTWSEDDEDDDFVNTPRESVQIFHKNSPPARPPPIKQSSLNKAQTSPQQTAVKSKSLPELKQQQQQQQQQRPATAARTPPVPFPRTKPNAKIVDLYDDDSDEWENFNGIRTAPAQTAYSSYNPKREPNVTRLGNIIEDKLTNRPSVHFTGAVDLLNKNETPKADDSDFSKVSSLEDDFLDNKPQIPRFSSTPATKGGHVETDASSNTYSTGVWGSSSKVVSSISASGSLGSNKQLTPSESEWDSD